MRSSPAEIRTRKLPIANPALYHTATSAPPYLAEADPGCGALFAEGRGERAEVGDDAGRDEHVAEQVVVNGLQVGRRLIPAILLAAETSDQLFGAHQLLRADRHLQVRHSCCRFEQLERYSVERTHPPTPPIPQNCYVKQTRRKHTHQNLTFFLFYYSCFTVVSIVFWHIRLLYVQ